MSMQEWKNDVPADTELLGLGAMRLRELKQDINERMELDHFWGDSGSITEGPTMQGRHKFITMAFMTKAPLIALDGAVLFARETGLYVLTESGEACLMDFSQGAK